MLKYRNRKQGILFWITGLQGSGKTLISKKLKPKIDKLYGKTLFCDGDLVRKMFEFKDYSMKGRLKIDKYYRNFCKFIINNNLNLIFATLSMSHKVRAQNRKIFKNYIEIYVVRNKKLRIKSRKKIFKIIKNENYELPKKPNIKINNNYKIDVVVDKTLKKVKKLLS